MVDLNHVDNHESTRIIVRGGENRLRKYNAEKNNKIKLLKIYNYNKKKY